MKRSKLYTSISLAFIFALGAGWMHHTEEPTKKETDGKVSSLTEENAISLHKAQQENRRIVNSGESVRGKLSGIANNARHTLVPTNTVGEMLSDVVRFAGELPDLNEWNKHDIADMYYKSEVLKSYAVDHQLQPIHELSNWVNSYIKGEILDELKVERERFDAHKVNLVHQAEEAWIRHIKRNEVSTQK